MSKTREKKIVHTGVTREAAEDAFARYAAADARQQQITAKMDGEIIRIREKYQDEISKLQETKDETFDIMQAFATEKKDQLFGKKKSLETVHGVFGFRTGNLKLKTRKGFTWAAVTNLLKEFLPAYVRTSEEPNKEKLISDRDIPEVQEAFPHIGVFIDQDETFFVEPKKEEVAVNA